MMRLSERGYNRLKFFPATAAGGPAFLKSLISPLPDLRFCPTGGITESTAPDWLSLANIPCLGGSWIAPAGDIKSGDFAGITARALKASRLGG
jgi:2-dehydro-3-deoxyphosphogluconate aldolase/(4S)-4-hydroxy-2-oxoglutarate aldolase